MSEEQSQSQPKKRRRGRPKNRLESTTVYAAVSAGSGRPAKPPSEKLKESVRFTCNRSFKEFFQEAAKQRGLNESDYTRLAVYLLLKQEGYLDSNEELLRNPTWETLWNFGAVPLPPRGPLDEE